MDSKCIHLRWMTTYNGVQYDGRHEAIIDEATWDRVQEMLKSHSKACICR